MKPGLKGVDRWSDFFWLVDATFGLLAVLWKMLVQRIQQVYHPPATLSLYSSLAWSVYTPTLSSTLCIMLVVMMGSKEFKTSRSILMLILRFSHTVCMWLYVAICGGKQRESSSVGSSSLGSSSVGSSRSLGSSSLRGCGCVCNAYSSALICTTTDLRH